MAALGGILGVCELTGSDYGAVENWKRLPNFPSRYFLAMWLELISRGYTASPSLWGQQLSRNKEAVLMILARKALQAA